MDTATSRQPAAQPCGLMRRLAAIFYDSLLLGAIWMAATFPVLAFTHGEAVRSGNLVYTTYLLLIGWLFFSWFWTRGGQTLGMRAWRIRVQTVNGAPLDWRQSTRRYLASVLSWLAFPFDSGVAGGDGFRRRGGRARDNYRQRWQFRGRGAFAAQPGTVPGQCHGGG